MNGQDGSAKQSLPTLSSFWFQPPFVRTGEDAMTGDTDKYLGPQDLKELGDDSLPAEGYMGFSLGARSARYSVRCSHVHFIPTIGALFLLTYYITGLYFFQKQNDIPKFDCLITSSVSNMYPFLNYYYLVLSPPPVLGGFVMAIA